MNEELSTNTSESITLTADEVSRRTTEFREERVHGEHYFYVNPLEVWPDACEKNPSKRHVRPVRQGWYQVACCPQNTLRTLAGIREYIYYTKGDMLYVGLYAGGDAEIPLQKQYAIAKTAQKLKAIPYCLWNNRGPGEMTVWIHMAYS